MGHEKKGEGEERARREKGKKKTAVLIKTRGSDRRRVLRPVRRALRRPVMHGGNKETDEGAEFETKVWGNW